MYKQLQLLLVFLAVAGTASASLVFNQAVVISGTGLGAVNTIATVLDQGGQGNGIEGGCVSRVGGMDTFACTPGTEITESDNQAINNTILVSATNFNIGDTFGAVVNINETGQDLSVTLTGLYLTFYDAAGGIIHTAQYLGPNLGLTAGTGTGLGQSGFVFTLDAAQQALVTTAFRVGGGLQFAGGSTSAGPDTLHLVSISGNVSEPPIPEPSTYMQLGGGLVALALYMRRRRTA